MCATREWDTQNAGSITESSVQVLGAMPSAVARDDQESACAVRQ